MDWTEAANWLFNLDAEAIQHKLSEVAKPAGHCILVFCYDNVVAQLACDAIILLRTYPAVRIFYFHLPC